MAQRGGRGQKKKLPKLGTGKRFQRLQRSLGRQEDGIEDPKALAAVIGRKKFGAKKMAKMAAAGRKRAK